MITILFLASGLLLLVMWWHNARREHEVSLWRVTSGTILSSGVEDDGEGYTFPKIEYEYHVAGCRYVSTVIYPGDFQLGVRARRLVSRYPAGLAVLVFHDELQPANAVLIPRLPRALRVSLLVAAIICLGVACWV